MWGFDLRNGWKKGDKVKPTVRQLRTEQISEEELDKWASYFSEYDWLSICQMQKLSESFMEKYQDKMDWKEVCIYQKFSFYFACKMELYKYIRFIAKSMNRHTRTMVDGLLMVKNKELNKNKIDEFLVFLRLIGNNQINEYHLLNAKGFDIATDDEDGTYINLVLTNELRVEVVDCTHDEELVRTIEQRLRDDLMIYMI
jgi:hypothetical protein